MVQDWLRALGSAAASAIQEIYPLCFCPDRAQSSLGDGRTSEKAQEEVRLAPISQEDFDSLCEVFATMKVDNLDQIIWEIPEWLGDWGERTGFIREFYGD